MKLTDAELAAVHAERRRIKRHLEWEMRTASGPACRICMAVLRDWLTKRTAREVEARRRAGRRRDV